MTLDGAPHAVVKTPHISRGNSYRLRAALTYTPRRMRFLTDLSPREVGRRSAQSAPNL
jgi:hypothetical protein